MACSKSSVKKLILKGVTMEQTVLGLGVSVPVEAGEQARTSPQYLYLELYITVKRRETDLSILSVSLPWPTHRPWGISR